MKKTKDILCAIFWIDIVLIPICLGLFFYTRESKSCTDFFNSNFELPISNLFIFIIIFFAVAIFIKIIINLLEKVISIDDKNIILNKENEKLKEYYSNSKLDFPIVNNNMKNINYLLECFTDEYPSLFSIQLYTFKQSNQDKKQIVEVSHSDYKYCRPMHNINSINEIYRIRTDLITQYEEIIKIMIADPNDERIKTYVEKIMKWIKNSSSLIDDSKVFLFSVLIIILKENMKVNEYFSLSDIPVELQEKLYSHKKIGFLLGIFSINEKVQFFSYRKNGEKKSRNYLCKRIRIFHRNYLFVITLNGDVHLSELGKISNGFCEMLDNELSQLS